MTTDVLADDSRIALTYDVVAILREEIGLREQFATPIAEAIVRGMCRRMGGERRYIPAPDKACRHADIVRDFNGRNREEVCRKHGISRAHLYRIIKEGV